MESLSEDQLTGNNGLAQLCTRMLSAEGPPALRSLG
jgi:hypothetical protein